jgi:hypothetical protein
VIDDFSGDFDPRVNFFTPAPIDRGQPATFPPGTQAQAFSTTWDGSPLTWTVRYFTLTPPLFFAEESATADASNIVNYCDSQPPSCNAGGPYVAPCGGTQTVVTLNGSGSSDPDSPISYNWNVVCNGEVPVVEGASTVNPVVRLARPGLGLPVSCSALLTVSGGGDSSECQSTINVPACNLDCLGQPGGSAQLDQCGVCNGSNSCLDCLGVPNGGAVLDRCNVCAGDGTSCLGCESTNVASIQISLDGGAQSQENLISRGLFRYRRVLGDSPSSRRISKKIREQARTLANKNWVTTWAYPSVVVSCTNTQFCVTASTSSITDSYRSVSVQLRDLGLDVTNRTERRAATAAQRRAARGLAKKVEAQHQLNLANVAKLPGSTTSCSA